MGGFLKRDSFHKAAWWMLLYAAVVTPVTATAGWWWMRHGMANMNDWRMPVHMWLGFSMTVVAIALAVWRGRLHRADRAPGLAYLLAASLAVAALVVQGELGGQMSFGSMDMGNETSHSERGAHETMPHGTDSRMRGSQPTNSPENHRHEHPDSSGSLEWRGLIFPTKSGRVPVRCQFCFASNASGLT